MNNGQSHPSIQPLPLALSILYFAVPALLLVLGFYVLMPALERRGLLPYYAYAIGLGLPMLGMLIASLIAYRLEGNPWTWSAFTARFRYLPLTGKDWLLTIAIFAAEMLIYMAISRITAAVIASGKVPLPANLPAFINPRTVFAQDALDTAMGGLRGNWLALILNFLLLIVNVVGEELWWRGYIFPRQELALGQWVWVAHGLLWAVFHIYKYWDVGNLVPLSLGLSLAVYLTRKSTPGLLIHFITNGVGLIPILVAVLGL